MLHVEASYKEERGPIRPLLAMFYLIIFCKAFLGQGNFIVMQYVQYMCVCVFVHVFIEC